MFRQGQSLYVNGQCSPLLLAGQHYEFSVDDKYGDFRVKIDVADQLHATCTCQGASMCRHRVAALMQLHELLRISDEDKPTPGIRYTRKGMIKRVIEERKEKARLASYRIEFADNIYGEHVLTNERGISYKLTFRDIERRHGYCSCPDYRTNKLGTCKHLIFAFETLQQNPEMIPPELPEFPFIEVFLNPFRNNKISWFYPAELTGKIAELFYRYFGNNKYIEDDAAESLPGFFRNAEKYKQILVRPEVLKKVEVLTEKSTLARLSRERKLDFSAIKVPLLPYQVQGVEFATFRTGAVIADEMGLGKSIQAIATALMKKDILGFTSTLIVCPATIKYRWSREIVQLTGKEALIVEGSPEERKQLYARDDVFFKVVNYETLIRDLDTIVQNPPDFIILDEAQRIRNYASVTAAALNSIPRKHALVITGTPIESRLIDLYSIILFVDPDLLSPLWEFSYQHCYFDENQKNRVVGYYDLETLNAKLATVMLRRQKHEVVGQLPEMSEIDIPVKLHPYQQKKHLQYAREALKVFSKKILTPYDIQKTAMLVRKMRMVADSTFLVDDTSNISPKLDELLHILSDKLNIAKSQRKVVIFTEWKKMINIIARALRLNKIGFVEITGDTPVSKRQELIHRFETEADCKVYLSTESGGNSLNLQVADTIIHFEVPYTTLQKSQRLGRIEDFGKRSGNVTIINLTAEDSLEEKIAGGLEPDKILNENLLSPDSEDVVMELTHDDRKAFLSALRDTIKAMEGKKPAAEVEESRQAGQMLLDFSEENPEVPQVHEVAKDINPDAWPDELLNQPDFRDFDKKEMENVLTSGVDFISNLFRITTGRKIDIRNDKLEYDPEAGEIIIRFKISK